ncbi:MAG: NAD(P)/FAD-dependent oxidoreductase [Candidatus Aenigmarchaeota archaeon]|nr:NAD(P)/FAD-dependent oxidoreductase [Candidatus Aenigmarchaeota archaeon]
MIEIPKEVDVLVVGMGPGGSGAAKRCAELGLKVLGVEKRAEIGAPKRCGEAISRHGMLDRIGIKPEGQWIMQEVCGAIVYAPNGKSVRVDYKGPEGWIVERKLFDKHLAALAANAGARVLAKVEAKNFRRNDGKVTAELEYEGGRHEVTAKIVIAADGVESMVARELGVNTSNKLVDICVGAQFEMAGVKGLTNLIEFYFGNDASPGGYVWVFSKGNGTANVGIGVRKPWAKKTALEYLEDWVRSQPRFRDASILEVNAGGVPVGGFLESNVADNLMVVGDAAHHVNPIHGGGIPEAYMAGKIAAEVAAEAVKKGDFSKKFLKKYDERWNRERGGSLKKILKLREVMESMSDDDLNWLVEYLKGDDLVELSRGNSGFARLAKILMKKPKLMKLARKLV